MRANLVAAIAFVAFSAVFTMNQASGVALNPRGLGQVLIFPYYTVNKSQDTLLSIGNAGGAGKMVHVRFRESYNARPVLEFNVFLSAHDVWTAGITQTSDDGVAELRTSDTSCTDPPLPASGQPFVTAGYAGGGFWPDLPPDSGPSTPDRTREGYIELIAIGDTTPGDALDQTITHVQTGLPGGGVPACAASVLQSAAPTVAPAPDLFGSVAIINVGQGTFFAYTPDALTGFTDTPLSTIDEPRHPTLEDANTADAAPLTRASVIVGNHPLDIDYEFPIDAVTAVFMADSIYNEYFVDSTFGASTDWVVTLPTRSFYTDPAETDVVLPPFFELFQDGRSDTTAVGTLYDREEDAVTTLGVCSGICPPPGNVQPPTFPYAVNIAAFAAGPPSQVFGSNVVPFHVQLLGATAGNLTLSFVDSGNIQQLPGGTDGNGATFTLLGLPVTGFMAYNVINTNAQPGLLANYSGVFANRATASCAGSSTSCTAIVTQQNPR
jgi:hypothetical protein